jgi:hypothetical protein
MHGTGLKEILKKCSGTCPADPGTAGRPWQTLLTQRRGAKVFGLVVLHATPPSQPCKRAGEEYVIVLVCDWVCHHCIPYVPCAVQIMRKKSPRVAPTAYIPCWTRPAPNPVQTAWGAASFWVAAARATTACRCNPTPLMQRPSHPPPCCQGAKARDPQWGSRGGTRDPQSTKKEG